MNAQRFIHAIDQISYWSGKACAWLIVALTLVVSVEVFKRYILNAPTAWIFDFNNMLYGTLFMMCGAYTLAQAGHVGLELPIDPRRVLAHLRGELGQASPVQIGQPRERLVGCAQHRAMRAADAERDLLHAVLLAPAAVARESFDAPENPPRATPCQGTGSLPAPE